MAHFAKVINGVVETVIAIHNNELLVDGVENEEKGKQFIASLGLTGQWIQTSVNNNFRKQYAGVGYTYDSIRDEFVARQPWESWTLDANNDWQPPVPKPTDGKNYSWFENLQQWVEVV